MKKKFSVLFFSLLITSMLLCYNIKTKNVFASNHDLDITSKSAYLINYETGDVVFKKNELEHLPIASMCKVMTLLICFENLQDGNISLEQDVIISHNASSMGGSQVFLEENNTYKVKDLIKSITIASANDSCVAMAELIAGSESNFVSLMNKKCSELKMLDTNFVNCTGLPKSGQYSCAKDVACMFSKLLSYSQYYDFSRIWLDKIYHSKDKYTEISNTNKLIRFFDGCDSGKTGYTSEAGHCLVASAKKNDMRMISVVINSPNSKTRFKEVSNMFNYSFNNYELKKIIDCNNNLDYDLDKIKDAKEDKLNIKSKENFYIFSLKNQKHIFDYEYEISPDLKAPIMINQKVGNLKIFENGVNVKTIELLAANSINKKNYSDSLNDIINNWIL